VKVAAVAAAPAKNSRRFISDDMCLLLPEAQKFNEKMKQIPMR